MPDESRLQILERNAAEAEALIADIQEKVNSVQKKIGQDLLRGSGDSVSKTISTVTSETERLQTEINHWQRVLTLRQIRNGQLYVHPPKISPVVVAGANSDIVTVKEVLTTKTEVKESGPVLSAKDSKTKNSATETVSPASQVNKKGEKKAEKAINTGAGGSKAKGPQPPVAEEVVDVGRLDLRVGKIVEVSQHPDADTLYVEIVDVGEPNLRTVVSGLVKHVPIEEMQNRMVILLCNLKPAKMRGVTSEAMVMCASSPEKVEILIPPAGSLPGDIVEFEGIQRTADPVLNPKKKIFETVAPFLKTSNEKIATYKGVPFEVKGKGVVTTPTLINVNIK